MSAFTRAEQALGVLHVYPCSSEMSTRASTARDDGRRVPSAAASETTRRGMAVHTTGTPSLVSQTPDRTATRGADTRDGVTSDVPGTDAEGGPGVPRDVDPDVSPDVISRHEERHEGTSFTPVPRDTSQDVPRDAAATTRPYPPEADPEPDVVVPEAVVPGEQTDPDRRAEVFPEDEPTD